MIDLQRTAMRYIPIILTIILLTACQSLAADDASSNLAIELEAYGTQVVSLRDQMQVDRTAIAATIEVGGTQIAAFTDYNGLLRATLQAGIPSTATLDPANFNSQGPMSLNTFDLSSGEMRFVQVGTAGLITPNDRCFVSHQNFFDNMNTSVIYMTALALNLRAGTAVRVDWQYGGEVVYSNGWTAPQSLDGKCVAIELRPDNVPFAPGNWTATMYIDGEAIDPAPFTIVGS
jgi:hypothetical protein